MKKIINGKVYDTDTAKELGSWRNAGSWREPANFSSTVRAVR